MGGGGRERATATDRQTDRQTGRQAGRQAFIHTHRRTDSQRQYRDRAR